VSLSIALFNAVALNTVSLNGVAPSYDRTSICRCAECGRANWLAAALRGHACAF
jgi:hypothetical protein